MNNSALKTGKHPSGQIIYFEEESHSYFLEDKSVDFTSVTTFIHQFFPEFDAPMVARRMVMREIRDGGMAVEESVIEARVDELLAKWDKKRDDACDFGTRVHENCEALLLNKDELHTPKDTREEKVMSLAKLEVQKLQNKLHFYASEAIIFSPSLALSGTIDLLMWDEQRGEVVILDWKTNSQIKLENRWQSGLSPISHLEDTNYNHYALQMSVYQFLLLHEGYFPPNTKFSRKLIHLHADSGVTYHEVPYLYDEVQAMLNQKGN